MTIYHGHSQMNNILPYYTVPLNCDDENITLLQIDMCNSLRNYNYLLHDNISGCTVAIDPMDADAILAVLNDKNWSLDYILSTHHHLDHTGGNAKLLEKTDCKVVGYSGDAKRIPNINILCDVDNPPDSFPNYKIEIMTLFGHTIGHIAYYFPSLQLVFSGDVMFSMGCGRIFEGSMQQGYDSLQKLAALPEQTLVAGAHEYTASNGQFACSLEPNNQELKLRMKQVKELRNKKLPTVPSTIKVEKPQTHSYVVIAMKLEKH